MWLLLRLHLLLLFLMTIQLETVAAMTSSNDMQNPITNHHSSGKKDRHHNQNLYRKKNRMLPFQDRHVASSPLAVAIVCRDGIALLSLHYEEESRSSHPTTTTTTTTASCLWDLPLSFRGPLRIETIYEHHHQYHNNNNNYRNNAHSSSLPLPPPMALLTAGWRADGLTLANTGREFMAHEVRVYCLPRTTTLSSQRSSVTTDPTAAAASASTTTTTTTAITSSTSSVSSISSHQKFPLEDTIIIDNDDQQPSQQQHRLYKAPYNYLFGRRIAEGLSYYLIQCAATISGGIGSGNNGNGSPSRPLSCVALLACGGNGDGGSSSSSRLYLIDSTGVQNVRGHAIGDAIVASKLHQRMMYVDFMNMDCTDGLKTLVRWIAKLDDDDDDDDDDADSSTRNKYDVFAVLVPSQEDDTKRNALECTAIQTTDDEEELSRQRVIVQGGTATTTTITLPSKKIHAAVEMAMIPNNGQGRMKRIRLSSLFTNTTTTTTTITTTSNLSPSSL